MTRKRTSLDALLRPREPAPVAAPRPEAATEEGRGPQRFKQQTVYLPIPVYEQLRRVAFDERVKMHGLLMEGLDRVFRERGLPGMTDLTRGDA